jgi:hypothetical protein
MLEEIQVGGPMRVFQPHRGVALPSAAETALAIAREHNEDIVLVINGVPVTVWRESTVEGVCALWRAANGAHVQAVMDRYATTKEP